MAANNEVQNSATYRQRNPLRVHANPTSQPLLTAGSSAVTPRRQQVKAATPTDLNGWLLYLGGCDPSDRQIKLGQLKRRDKDMHTAVLAVLRRPSEPVVEVSQRPAAARVSKIGPEEPQSVEMTAALPITNVNADVADTSVVVVTTPPDSKPVAVQVPPTMVTPQQKPKPPKPSNMAMLQASTGAMTGQANGNRSISPGSAR